MPLKVTVICIVEGPFQLDPAFALLNKALGILPSRNLLGVVFGARVEMQNSKRLFEQCSENLKHPELILSRKVCTKNRNFYFLNYNL